MTFHHRAAYRRTLNALCARPKAEIDARMLLLLPAVVILPLVFSLLVIGNHKNEGIER